MICGPGHNGKKFGPVLYPDCAMKCDSLGQKRSLTETFKETLFSFVGLKILEL